MVALATGARARLKPLVVVGALLSLGWGLVVAFEGAFVGGTLLAIPNSGIAGAARFLTISQISQISFGVTRAWLLAALACVGLQEFDAVAGRFGELWSAADAMSGDPAPVGSHPR